MKIKYDDCINYIENKQKELTYYLPKDKDNHIGLPNPFIAPSFRLGIFENDQFYWDSYFIILGLIYSNQINLAKGIVDNFAYLYEKFGIIPARNRFYNLENSQPPFFTSMILEVFNKTKDKIWLLKMTKIAEKELREYWMSFDENYKLYEQLSRYGVNLHTNLIAEHESGWDITSRFQEKCLDFLPIDLNSLLYKYEMDLSLIYDLFEDKSKSKYYLDMANKRKKKINKLMWNEEVGFYFDYNHQDKQYSNFYSLAGFYPLWTKLATKQQATKLKENIIRFEFEGGLANTQKENLSTIFKQWDYPNGWPNQQWIVIKGLLNYGFKEDATRLTNKWLGMNKKIYEKTGTFWEKYNVVTSDCGKDGRYPTQKGFGWTNAVFMSLLNEFDK